MRLRWRFRSLYVQCFSGAPEPVNVSGGLAAAPLTTPAPGQENRRFAVPSAYSFRLSGRGRSYIPVGRPLSAHPCASPRPPVNASAIFSRNREPLRVLCLSDYFCRWRFNFGLCEQPSRASLDTPSAKRYLLATPAKSGVRVGPLLFSSVIKLVFIAQPVTPQWWAGRWHRKVRR